MIRLSQVAAELGISRDTLKSWARSGAIDVGRTVGQGRRPGVYVFTRAQVDELRRRIEGGGPCV